MQTHYSARRRFGQRNYSNNYGSERRSQAGFSGSYRPRFRSRNNRRGEKEAIDISRFIQRSSDFQEEKPIQVTHTFEDFNFCSEIKTNLRKKNYTIPMPIQDQAIDHIAQGKDLIGLANTGTGKTAAFLLPLINKVARNRSEKVLIIAPTRELATQIAREFQDFSWGSRIYYALCVGGLPIYKQIDDLRKSPNFVIGTPGRLKDLGERGHIKYGTFSNVVIDEVDRMMDMGFIDDIRSIVSQLSEKRQSLFFSATMPEKIRELANQFLVDPVTVEVLRGETTHNVDQDIVHVPNKEMKYGKLQDLLLQPELNKVLIFIETKAEVERLANDLISGGFKAESIHGDKRQSRRQRALDLFKKGKVNILVATDVAARGLDIKDITHVINYTLPRTYDDYIHRIGRTGRGNNKGKALTFVEKPY